MKMIRQTLFFILITSGSFYLNIRLPIPILAVETLSEPSQIHQKGKGESYIPHADRGLIRLRNVISQRNNSRGLISVEDALGVIEKFVNLLTGGYSPIGEFLEDGQFNTSHYGWGVAEVIAQLYFVEVAKSLPSDKKGSFIQELFDSKIVNDKDAFEKLVNSNLSKASQLLDSVLSYMLENAPAEAQYNEVFQQHKRKIEEATENLLSEIPWWYLHGFDQPLESKQDLPAKDQLNKVTEELVNILQSASGGMAELIKEGLLIMDEDGGTNLIALPKPWERSIECGITSLVITHKALSLGIENSTRYVLGIPFITQTRSGERMGEIKHAMATVFISGVEYVFDFTRVGQILGIHGWKRREEVIPDEWWRTRKPVSAQWSRKYLTSSERGIEISDIPSEGPEIFPSPLLDPKVQGFEEAMVPLEDFKSEKGREFLVSGGLVRAFKRISPSEAREVVLLNYSMDGPVVFDRQRQALRTSQAFTVTFLIEVSKIYRLKELMQLVQPKDFVRWLYQEAPKELGIQVIRKVIPDEGSELWRYLPERGSGLYYFAANLFTPRTMSGKDLIQKFELREQVESRKKDDQRQLEPEVTEHLTHESVEAGIYSHEIFWIGSPLPSLSQSTREQIKTLITRRGEMNYHRLSEGRSIIVLLDRPIEMNDKWYRAVKIKAIAFNEKGRPQPIQLTLYTGRGRPGGIGHFDDQGKISISRPSDEPLGGLLWVEAMTEFEASFKGFQRRAPVNPPAFLGKFIHPEMVFRGRQLGFYGEFLEDSEDKRTDIKMIEWARSVLLRSNIPNDHEIHQFFRAIGRALRDYHEKNLLHGGFTGLDNFQFVNESIKIVDQENSLDKALLTDSSIIGYQLNDLNVLAVSLEEFLSSERQSMTAHLFDKGPFDILQGYFRIDILDLILEGYFYDRKNDPRIGSIKNGEIAKVFSDATDMIFPVSIASVKADSVELTREISIKRKTEAPTDQLMAISL